MTTQEMQTIKEYARNLGYVVKDNKTYENLVDFDNSAFIVCLPNTEDYESILDYTYDDENMFDLMECVDVFFEENPDNKDDMLAWYSHYERLEHFSLNKLKSILVRVMKEYKQKKIDLKKSEIEKDFVN